MHGELQTALHLGAQFAEWQLQNRFPGIEHHVHRGFLCWPGQADRFPHPAFDPVAFDRASEYLTDGKTDSKRIGSRRIIAVAPQKKRCHVPSELPAPLLVHLLKFSVTQQALRFWEYTAGLGQNLLPSKDYREILGTVELQMCFSGNDIAPDYSR